MPEPIPDRPGGERTAARRILLRGRVQGVGFRPFVHRLAGRWALTGWVRNLSGRVVVHVEGLPDRIEAFQAALVTDAPSFARPELAESTAAVPTGLDGFFIEESVSGGSADVSVPPDVALCADCRRELSDRRDRRYRYPFLNCTQCGPRYTILASLPYDRARTSMERFALCSDCRAEYGDPEDRRYHAEPVACPSCGPRIELVPPPARVPPVVPPGEGSARAASSGPTQTRASSGRAASSGPTQTRASSAHSGEEVPLLGEEALAGLTRVLGSGGIAAVQGVGGYHLVCDATSSRAVATLRARKRRPGKPLAVMVPREGDGGLTAARALAEIGPAAAEALVSGTHPIVLVPRHPDAQIAEEVAPGLRELGIMLPYSPLHELILGSVRRPLVATSGNSSGEPLVSTRYEAERELSGIVDVFLHHDRPILRSIDDSVLRDLGGRVVPIRIGRGLGPLELPLPRGSSAPRLAAGGHMKSAVALAWGERAVLSPHLGDLDRPRAVDAFVQSTESLRVLYSVEPEEIVGDAHPDYASTRWARSAGLPFRSVPHHRAHASALAAEHPDVRRWLVFAWDGVGLGEDGTLWGGEAFHGSPGRWERVGSVRPFRIVGAGRAGRESHRSAQALAWEIGASLPDDAAPLSRGAWDRELGTSVTTAIGRIFDGAAALVLGRTDYDYEAQGPMEVEAVAEGEGEALELPLERDPGSVWRIDWEPLVRRLLEARVPARERAASLHATLARAAVRLALRVHEERPFDAVGLTGGVFQNRRLTEAVIDRGRADGLDVRIAERVPMNDGGLAYGQLVETIASEES